jgi:predicted AAA+ superfamily ATPase
MSDKDILNALRMIADSLERTAPPAARSSDLGRGDAFVWQHAGGWLAPVAYVAGFTVLIATLGWAPRG